mmetsp:Transcript_52278/g.118173  ORF Transcript_52278/g.118173 Transcript_52278/m.118173 type:complete len:727 (+) Transcript_52278:83-2263(+)
MSRSMMLPLLLLALAGSSSAAPIVGSSAITADMSPIRKVITLVEEMKAQCEKDADEDEAAFSKHKCWCETNEKEKTAAIKAAEGRIEELTAFVEEAAAKEGQLKTEIAGLEGDIAEDKEALATATALREKESAEFLAEEADMKETSAALTEAIQVLSKVQLIQKGRADPAATTALLQVRNVIQRHYPKFHGVMQRDLFDVLSSLKDMVPQAFLRKQRSTALDQLLPWEKTEEQIGMEAKPNDLKGMAANAKSYNSRSGQILGVLAEMRDEFNRDLSEAQKADFQALVAFQQLRSAKLSEIAAATEQMETKEASLADLLDQAAKAKEDMEATKTALGADQRFMIDLAKNCEAEKQEYESRAQVRGEEIRALGEALKILTADDARDLFGKTISLMQVSSSRRSVTGVVAAQERASQRAMERLTQVARKTGNWALASLAVQVRLDAFTKVKEAMDKMFKELEQQQKQEYEKKDLCNQEIDKTEDKVKVGENTKEDLEEKHTGLVNTLASLDSDITTLKAEIAEMEVSLKQAGEQRKQENAIYRSSVADQRATAQILQKTLARLKAFYEGKAFIQTRQGKPGEASSLEPAKGKEYKKSALGGGVIQLLMKIIKDAEVVEQELQLDEQKAQEMYESFAKDTSSSIEAAREAVATKSEQTAAASGEKSETEQAQLANDGELASLAELLKATHLECDWLLKYFDVRQTARAEEMDAITEAKAILSGADFGAAQ